jgi:site-specific DNA-methyltransferase (adenine-specific)
MTDFEKFLGGRVRLAHGDSRDVLKSLPDNSIDSVCTDPPYALVSIVKRFGGANAAPTRDGDVYSRASAGFMGQNWDTGETAFAVEFWQEVMRVLKPGGHVIAASGTRTYHRLAVAIEDAGFEIRDMVSWLYGSGFPKSHDVSKGIDKAAGAEREVVGQAKRTGKEAGTYGAMAGDNVITAAATPEAKQWEGWGTALKPACEPWVLARKPLAGTVAGNVLAHGTGALNINACRVGEEERTYEPKGTSANAAMIRVPIHRIGVSGEEVTVKGRWPANVIHDGSDEVVGAFPDSKSTIGKPRSAAPGIGYGMTHTGAEYSDEGSAARFFYSAKADAMDRIGSKHPTVKPVDLMQYLCRLITPPGGTVLDPFAGSGSTGEAAYREGFNCVLIEREADYVEDIRERLRLAPAGARARKRAVSKKKAVAPSIGGMFS